MAIPWNQLRLGLLALGYRAVLHVEITCFRCGIWRGTIEPAPDDLIPCPCCAGPSILAISIEGFTKREMLPPWEKVAGPLSRLAREWISFQEEQTTRVARWQQARQRRENERITREVMKRGRGLTRPIDMRPSGR